MTIRTFRKTGKIQAVQWTGENFDEIEDWVGSGDVEVWGDNRLDIWNDSEELWFTASQGDWVAKSDEGDFYRIENEYISDPETYEPCSA